MRPLYRSLKLTPKIRVAIQEHPSLYIIHEAYLFFFFYFLFLPSNLCTVLIYHTSVIIVGPFKGVAPPFPARAPRPVLFSVPLATLTIYRGTLFVSWALRLFAPPFSPSLLFREGSNCLNGQNMIFMKGLLWGVRGLP